MYVKNNNYSYAIYGLANGSLDNYGVYGRAYNGGYGNYAIFGNASGSGNNKWAGYFLGNVYASGYYQPSDERLKKNMNLLDGKEILSKIGQLEPVSFEFLSDAELFQNGLPALNAKEGEHIGLLAQEVEKVFPELVIDVVSPVTDEGGDPKTNENSDQKSEQDFVIIKAINYQELSVALLAAIQEQQAKIEELERKMAALGN